MTTKKREKHLLELYRYTKVDSSFLKGLTDLNRHLFLHFSDVICLQWTRNSPRDTLILPSKPNICLSRSLRSLYLDVGVRVLTRVLYRGALA